MGILTVAAATPGPNNFIVMSAAANRGLLAAAPPIAGVIAGGLLLLGGAWIGGALATPGVQRTVGLVGAGYLAWLGARMMLQAGRAARARDAAAPGLPASCLAVLLFQLVNPKAWTLALTVTAIVRSDRSLWAFAALATAFAAVSFVCLSAWSAFGSVLAPAMQNDRTAKALNVALGGVLLVSSLGLLMTLRNGELQ